MLETSAPTAAWIPLDGPVLASLPRCETKLALCRKSRCADQTARQAYVDAQRVAGKPLIRLTRPLRQQTRPSLAGVLTPPQIEEFLLRYSQNATTIRSELGQLKYL